MCELWDVVKMAEFLGVAPNWVYRNKDFLPYIRLGNGAKSEIRFPSDSVQQWIHRESSKKLLAGTSA